MTGVTLTLAGWDEFNEYFKGMAERLENPEALWLNIGEEIKRQTEHRFDTGTGPDGKKWPDSWRVLAREGGGPTLVDTGLLKQTLTVNADRHGGEVGSSMPYAAIHQFGGTIKQPARKQVLNFKVNKKGEFKRGFAKQRAANYNMRVDAGERSVTIPARPFIGMDDEGSDRLMDIAASYFIGVKL